MQFLLYNSGNRPEIVIFKNLKLQNFKNKILEQGKKCLQVFLLDV